MGTDVGDSDGIRGQDVIVYWKTRWRRINVGEGARIIRRWDVEVQGGECRAGGDGE